MNQYCPWYISRVSQYSPLSVRKFKNPSEVTFERLRIILKKYCKNYGEISEYRSYGIPKFVVKFWNSEKFCYSFWKTWQKCYRNVKVKETWATLWKKTEKNI